MLTNFNLTLEEFIFSEEQLIKNPMEYEGKIESFIEKRDEDYKTLFREVEDLPRDVAQKVVRNGRDIIFFDADLEKAIKTVREERKNLEEQSKDEPDYSK